MIGLDALGIAAATLPAAVAIHHALDRAEPTRWRNMGFWGLFAVLLGAGPWLPDLTNGCLVLAMVGLATCALADLMTFVKNSPGDPSWSED